MADAQQDADRDDHPRCQQSATALLFVIKRGWVASGGGV